MYLDVNLLSCTCTCSVMSLEVRKGNSKKKGQKYQNSSAFRNNMHDTGLKQKLINGLVIAGVCARCKEAIEWKRKYKKYKPLKAPATCVKCQQKTVRHAYHTLCTKCAQEAGVCEKCGNNKEVLTRSKVSAEEQAAQDSALQQDLTMLSERQRRTFFRHMEKGGTVEGAVGGSAQDSSEDDECDDNNSDDDNDRTMSDDIQSRHKDTQAEQEHEHKQQMAVDS